MEKLYGVVLLSGGIDSTVTLYYAVKKMGLDCIGLYVDYGSKHTSKELSFSKYHCKVLQIPHKNVVYDLSSIVKSDLLHSGNSTKLSTPENSVVPFRNLFLVTIAAAVGYTYFSSHVNSHIANRDLFILTGANEADYNEYRDCRYTFFNYLEHTLNEGSSDRKFLYKIYNPLQKYKKSEIIKLGKELDVPFEKTWTCYKGESVPCGQCAACVVRIQGFLDAGLSDPLSYR